MPIFVKILMFILMNWKTIFELVKTVKDEVNGGDPACVQKAMDNLKSKCSRTIPAS